MDVEKRNQLLSIVLAIVIAVLAYFLYHAIVDPYKVVEQEKQMTKRVRHQMGSVRDALIRYENDKDTFPPTKGGLDSLVQYLKTDSLMITMGDSLFKPLNPAESYNPDSLIYSPRPPHKKFSYQLNDQIRPAIYLLKDPDSGDKIGSLRQTTLLNAGSWE